MAASIMGNLHLNRIVIVQVQGFAEFAPGDDLDGIFRVVGAGGLDDRASLPPDPAGGDHLAPPNVRSSAVNPGGISIHPA